MSIDRLDPNRATKPLFVRPWGGCGCRPWARSARSAGVARGGLLGALLLVLVGVLSLTLWGPWSQDLDRAPGPAGPGAGQGTQRTRTDLPTPADDSLEAVPIPVVDLDVPMEWKNHRKLFDSTCTISGVVEVRGDAPFPPRWRLVIQPSRLSIGRENAARRVVDFVDGERTFEEIDLPMGGYRVHVEAVGMSCRGQEVMLFRLEGFEHLPGKNHAHLMLQLIPAGFVEGAVRDTDGVPVAELPVILENQQDRTRMETKTDLAGIWRLDEVIEGPYKIFLASVDSPLAEVETFGMVGSQHRHPDQIVPRVQTVTIRVVDEAGAPLSAARLRGYGRPQGVIETTSALDGSASAPFLPEGEYTLRGEHTSGRQGVTVFSVGIQAPPQPITLQLTPRR